MILSSTATVLSLYAAYAAAGTSGYVSMNVKRIQSPSAQNNTSNFTLAKRFEHYDETVSLINEEYFYATNISVGTPNQHLIALVDTGSSDLWIPQSCVSNSDCTFAGTFDPSKSSTFKSNGTDFFIEYVDLTQAKGVWGRDTLFVDGIDASGLSFATVNRSSSFGVLGIGLAASESSNEPCEGKACPLPQYDNFPLVLKRKGEIERVVYSLFLDDSKADTGSILFGAVNSNGYSGSLYTIPLISGIEGVKEITALTVTLQGVGIKIDGYRNTLTTTKIPALLDSGTTYTYLPKELLTMIVDAIGAFELFGEHYQFCSAADNTELVFDFGGVQITIDLSDVLVPYHGDICVLRLYEQNADVPILGDNFLRSAYVVYDLDKKEVALAQADYSNPEVNIEVVTADIPGAKQAPGYSNTWVSSEYITSGGNIFTAAS